MNETGERSRASVTSGEGSMPVRTLSQGERRQMPLEWNDTRRCYDTAATLAELFDAQVDRTPDGVALIAGDERLTYRELDTRANRLAHYLLGLEVGPDALVGICLERGPEMVVALLATLKAGAAYVPLDPSYPRERLRLIADDAGLAVLLTQNDLAELFPENEVRVVCIDTDALEIEQEPTERPTALALAGDLAYVLYTSGSTGRPKGVMVTQRNVVNFFAGMDERIGADPPGIWLAVTSLSFDISVLELLWTLTRGFSVVLYAGGREDAARQEAVRRAARVAHPIELSLFYFASDEGERGADKYRLLIEGAKFADRHGFAAVWTPERHFHAFGGLYPNPAVTSAAIAAVTERVQIRAGSCVLPLHNPIRVAEEWALVDNLSNGRAGISFASGWQPDDFAIVPANFASRKEAMFDGIETVRRLWRGEKISVPGPLGKDVAVRTLPRPVQPELPVWLTAAGNPETFRAAGEMGVNLLTHLLGQSVEELAEKIALYRAAWLANGHGPESGRVTLMLHTFVGANDDAVRARVREPMKQYLRSSVDLIEKAAWTFPPLRQRSEATGEAPAIDGLSEEEMDALLDHAFERYASTSGLFGTPERCLEMLDRLREIGVDEVACLIDFGVDTDTVLEHFTHLATLRELSLPQAQAADDASIPALIERHAVTHLQCTPSMASMLLLDERTPAGLSRLHALLLGGEALPPSLAQQLRPILRGRLLNMYGPTETTIWSSTYEIDRHPNVVPIGRPIANTTFYIVDEMLQPLPAGAAGELLIGGDGVARGYLNRPELTAERFIPDPVSKQAGARLYRTGDVARCLADGNVEFLGRLDHQVKLRGHRIELGEIESELARHVAVREAVVIAREDQPGDQRLVAYITARVASVDTDELRACVGERLPEFMVPAHIVQLAALPMTPNAKIDRRALPAPEDVPAQPAAALALPRTETEREVAAIWQDLLGVSAIGVDDSFFALGGHSLLAAQVVARLRSRLGVDLPLRALFGAPTIAGLATEIDRARSGRPEPLSRGSAPIMRRAQGLPVSMLTGSNAGEG